MLTTTVRSEIHQIVSSISPLDDLEQEHIQFTRDWIESGSDLFRLEKPATPLTHLVTYFVIISPEKDKILLVDHKKAELWVPPGGHVDPDEHLKETVLREAKEELGIEAEFLFEEPLFLTVTDIVDNITKHTDVTFWYLLKLDPDQILNFDPEEFNQIKWFAINEIPFEESEPQMKRFLQKII